MTRVLVVGAGSIGLRHARVLEGIGHEVAHVTSRHDLARRSFTELESGLTVFKPSYVVVATETWMHASSVSALSELGYDGTLLVEKPLGVPRSTFDGNPFERVGVGFNLRFHPALMRLRAALVDSAVYAVDVYAGQHLSTWRPGRAIGDQYSGSRERGGGVLRDLSHELDYLTWLFGANRGVFALGGRFGDVTTDSDDAWGIVARFERAPLVSLQLNYFDAVARRRIVVNTSDGTVEVDLVHGTIQINEELLTFDLDPDATYRALHEAMLAEVAGEFATVEDSLATDELISKIELSGTNGNWVA